MTEAHITAARLMSFHDALIVFCVHKQADMQFDCESAVSSVMITEILRETYRFIADDIFISHTESTNMCLTQRIAAHASRLFEC